MTENTQPTEVASKKTKTIKCDICGRAFKSAVGLGVHQSRMHKHEASTNGSMRDQILRVMYPDGPPSWDTLDTVGPLVDELLAKR